MDGGAVAAAATEEEVVAGPIPPPYPYWAATKAGRTRETVVAVKRTTFKVIRLECVKKVVFLIDSGEGRRWGRTNEYQTPLLVYQVCR